MWIKDSESAIVEWSTNNRSLLPLKLIIMENNKPLPIIQLNKTDNYHLIENLKPSTTYSICLQTTEQYLCRNITTKSQQYVSLSSSSSSITISIEYILIGITFGIVIIMLIIFILTLLLIKQRKQYTHSLKPTPIDTYYQATCSDTTHIATSNNSIEENSIKSFQRHQSTPIFCYCHLPSTYGHDQQPYHLYHEIPIYKPPIMI